MKKLVMSIVLVAMLGGLGQVVAQEGNLLGLYFDPYGEMDCLEAASLAPFTAVDLYVILKSPTFHMLGGYEFGIEVDGPALITGWDYPFGFAGFNFGEGDNYIVGLQNDYPMEDVNILLTFEIFYMSTTSEGVCFTLGGSEPSSLDPLYPTFFGDDELFSASVNNGIDGACTALISETECNVVSTDSQTWDSLKSLYR